MQIRETWSPINSLHLLIKAARRQGLNGWISAAVLQRRMRVSKEVALWLMQTLEDTP